MKPRFGVFIILLSGVFWGSSCLFINGLSGVGFSAAQITTVRLTVAALILNLMLIVKGKGFRYYKMPWQSYLYLFCAGIFTVFTMCNSYYRSVVETSSAVAAILLYLAPIFVMLMSLYFFGERLTVQKCVAGVLALVGCGLVSGIASGFTFNLQGVLFGLLSGFSYALYSIFSVFFMRKNKEPLVFTTFCFTFAALACLIFSPPWVIGSMAAASETPALTLLLFVLLGLCTGVIPFSLYTAGLVAVKPDVAAILSYAEPLTACIFSVLILHEPMDGFGVAGVILVCAAIVLLNIKLGPCKGRAAKDTAA